MKEALPMQHLQALIDRPGEFWRQEFDALICVCFTSAITHRKKCAHAGPVEISRQSSVMSAPAVCGK